MSDRSQRGLEVHHGWGSAAIEHGRIRERNVPQGEAGLWIGNDMSWGGGGGGRPSRQHYSAAGNRIIYHSTIFGLATILVVVGIIILVAKMGVMG